MEYDDALLDDPMLLQDRLIRSLHRNPDGHLANNRSNHLISIEDEHNIASIYIYTADDNSYSYREHYVFSHNPLSYKEWLGVVIAECFKIEANPPEQYYGIYGWNTSYLQIHPLRNGDLFIKIDEDGAQGVRLTFNSGKAKLETQPKKKPKQKTR